MPRDLETMLKTLMGLSLLLSGCANFADREPLTFEQRIALTQVLQNNRPYIQPPPPVLSVPQYHATVCTPGPNYTLVCQ